MLYIMFVPVIFSVCAVNRLCVTLMSDQMNTCLRQMSQYFWDCIVVLGTIKD